jgi:RecJ-like exonuclease
MNSNFNLPPGCTDKMIDAHMGAGMDTCPDCDGEKHTGDSDCCGAAFASPGWPDNDVCSACGEHSEPSKCERCDGTGEINVDEERARNKEQAEIDRADRMNDEARDERKEWAGME